MKYFLTLVLLMSSLASFAQGRKLMLDHRNGLKISDTMNEQYFSRFQVEGKAVGSDNSIQIACFSNRRSHLLWFDNRKNHGSLFQIDLKTCLSLTQNLYTTFRKGKNFEIFLDWPGEKVLGYRQKFKSPRKVFVIGKTQTTSGYLRNGPHRRDMQFMDGQKNYFMIRCHNVLNTGYIFKNGRKIAQYSDGDTCYRQLDKIESRQSGQAIVLDLWTKRANKISEI